jgi:hypothetical protein
VCFRSKVVSGITYLGAGVDMLCAFGFSRRMFLYTDFFALNLPVIRRHLNMFVTASSRKLLIYIMPDNDGR